jgi:uncharacterized membrane protein
MPFCTQCGTTVGGSDAYCANCGAQQPEVARQQGDFLGSMRPNTAALLCYIPFVGWIAAIVVLASQRFRFDRDVRFHAFQGLYLFVAWLILDWGVGPFFAFVPRNVFHFSVAGMLKMVVMAAWIFMIIKASQGERYRLPVFGELAERSLTEQQS